MLDFIVIGAGYSGLAIGSLLSKKGQNGLVFESHTTVGGCAGYFKRKSFTFDAGATTISGVLNNQPFGWLFNNLGITLNLKKINPGMIIKTNNKEIVRYSEKNKWIEEVEKSFLIPQKELWEKLYKLEEKSWGLTNDIENFPPKNIMDLVNLAKIKNLKYIDLLPGLFLPLEKILNRKQINNYDFMKFLNEQLIISTQSDIKNVPYLTASIGLTYPSETYYHYGGISKPAEKLVEYINNTNEVKLKEKVISIEKLNKAYRVKTSRNKTYYSKHLISSLPIWNMPNITEGKIRNYYLKKQKMYDFAWGAFTIYFAVKTKWQPKSCYYQIHTSEKIPICNSDSFFVSFSLPDDNLKAPEGYLTVTISTHTKTENWFGISKERYNERKKIVEEFIIKEFNNKFQELNKSEKILKNSGTPSSFEFFTKRKNGYVGGIPHSTKNLLLMQNFKTPFKNLYNIGDTTFPGQGISSVILSAINTYKHISKNKI